MSAATVAMLMTLNFTNKVLKELDLQNIDFTFLDGGHSYQTVINDLTTLYGTMKYKKKVILCDDYGK